MLLGASLLAAVALPMASYADSTNADVTAQFTAQITELRNVIKQLRDVLKEIRTQLALPPSTGGPNETIPPVITAISTNQGDRSATVRWSTNEETSGRVYYSPTTVSIGSSSTAVANSDGTHTQRSASLTGLATGTTYYYVIEAEDLSGNITRSAQFSLMTTTPDTIAPLISYINGSTSSTSATITWTTGEASTSAVFYGTVSPIERTSTAAYRRDNTLVTSHSMTLAGLAADTTYYYIVESSDNSNNIATSGQFSFRTNP